MDLALIPQTSEVLTGQLALKAHRGLKVSRAHKVSKA
jgi:hypothetical protein